MKILIVSSSSGSRGGGELALLYLGLALRERGHDVILWASDHPRMNELAEAFAKFGDVVRVPYTNTYDRPGRSIAAFCDVPTARRIAAHWRTLAPDIIHLNKQNLEDGLDLMRAARLAKIPTVAMIHITQTARYLRASFARLRDLISWISLDRHPWLFATTPGPRQYDLSVFIWGAVRVRTVWNGVPIPRLSALAQQRSERRAELEVKPDEMLFMAVGRMMPQKRPLLFIEIAERVLRRIPNARFLWIGDGDLVDEFDSLVAEKKLRAQIRRLPWQKDASRFLPAADVFMHVAEFEGLSFAFLEAFAASLPCAVTRNLRKDMTFLTDTNSITIDDRDEWLDVVVDVEKRVELGRNARALAERKFSFRAMAAGYEDIYRETRVYQR